MKPPPLDLIHYRANRLVLVRDCAGCHHPRCARVVADIALRQPPLRFYPNHFAVHRCRSHEHALPLFTGNFKRDKVWRKAMTNLDMITTAPHWRVRIVVLVAKALGVTIKLEGFPFGSRRAMTPWQPSGTIGLAQGAALGSSLVRLP